MMFTNYGNNYKFKAIMERRSNKNTVIVQRLRKDGTWGKPVSEEAYGAETPAQVVERLNEYNPHTKFRLAQ